MSERKGIQLRRYRAEVLSLVYANHEQQRSPLDATMLWGLMQSLSFQVGENEVLTVLQDLQDRGYLAFEEKRNRLTGRCQITRIKITGQGRDLVEATRSDEAVLFPG